MVSTLEQTFPATYERDSDNVIAQIKSLEEEMMKEHKLSVTAQKPNPLLEFAGGDNSNGLSDRVDISLSSREKNLDAIDILKAVRQIEVLVTRNRGHIDKSAFNSLNDLVYQKLTEALTEGVDFNLKFTAEF
ncbi:hypothetical protein A2716_04960 [candidate division WWE3 bacterium RIFCSPHIGHO2_01_FULL_40_23]|uniref:Uncharacterized protein n=1 Tax=candidate division WWE3 bacterium RIFCSPLOWO2_01_FULL_41_18 TaxID=1802625 RepID=A0A1F4VE54_UNCKA|nr:MAG: hypothetical protein A2716_04960 [candidate division WWE3 bacterium RIFCSPHIGHO2_01_FULL_40_23]OGC55220.1 MAG: hypothetical protein A3A78_04570 [candidate division WWE3 bacterium RIFCSPLOWO2_01_FULL_41_18]